MTLVEGEADALASAARLRELALLLARAAVLVVVLQVHALVVAARGVAAAAVQCQVAHVVVLAAVVGCPRVLIVVLEEPANAGGGQSRFPGGRGRGRWRRRRRTGVLSRED